MIKTCVKVKLKLFDPKVKCVKLILFDKSIS